MKTRDLVAVATAILNFQNGRHRTQNCYNFGLHVNICMEFCVLMASCITNHTKFKDISPDSCNRLHYYFSKCPPPKTQNCYNFGLHVNICMKFGVLMASYVTNHTKCQDISPGSCESPHSKFSKWPPLKT